MEWLHIMCFPAPLLERIMKFRNLNPKSLRRMVFHDLFQQVMWKIVHVKFHFGIWVLNQKYGKTPKASILIGFFIMYKPSIWGYPYFWKHPYVFVWCHHDILFWPSIPIFRNLRTGNLAKGTSITHTHTHISYWYVLVMEKDSSKQHVLAQNNMLTVLCSNDMFPL